MNLFPKQTHSHRKLYSVSCNNLQWKRIFKGIYLGTTKPLCHTLETNNILN